MNICETVEPTTNSPSINVVATHHNQNEKLVNDEKSYTVTEYKACQMRLEYMEKKVSSLSHSIESFLTATANDCNDASIQDAAVCCKFLQDVSTCINDDVSCESMLAKLNSHVLKLNSRACFPTSPIHEHTTRLRYQSSVLFFRGYHCQ